jgi:secretion system chaperone SscA
MTFSTHDLEYDHDALLRAFFAGETSTRIPEDVDPRDLNALQQLARRRFDAGDWATARDGYFMLARLDSRNFDYWFNLGLCYQHLERHEHAIFCLSWSDLLCAGDPRPFYHAGLSYQRIGDTEYAVKSFRTARNWCGDNAAHRALKARIEQCLDGFDEEA